LKPPMKIVRREYTLQAAERKLGELLSKYLAAVDRDEWPPAERAYCDRVECGFREKCWGKGNGTQEAQKAGFEF